MKLKTNISIEESFLIDILFKDKKTSNKKFEIEKINYDSLVKIASERNSKYFDE